MKISTPFYQTFGLFILMICSLSSSWATTHSKIAPPPIIAGSSYACPGSTFSYIVSNANSSTSYQWYLSSGGTIISQNNDIVEVLWGQNSVGTHQLSVEATTGSTTEVGVLNVTLEGDIVLVCNDDLNVSLPDDCVVEITADIMLEGMILPEESYTIEIRNAAGALIYDPIDASYINQTLEVTVIHNCTGNKCWGHVTIEDKVAPIISCQDVTLSCEEAQNFQPQAELLSDNCANTELLYTEYELDIDCDPNFSRIIEYVWTAVDYSGNVAIPCTSSVSILRENMNEIENPINFDGLPGNYAPLSCSGVYALTDEGYPHPDYTGRPGGDFNCGTIQFTYTDISLPICDQNCGFSYNSYKILREWTILDWCAGVTKKVTQIIKIMDLEAPIVQDIPDITMSVNPFDCSGQIPLPIPSATDNCTVESYLSVDYQSSVGVVINGILHLDSPAKTMPNNEIIVEAIVSDCCGNQTIKPFNLTVIDNTPPVIVADLHETISLLPNGLTTLYATSLDDGSYDNCSGVGFFVKRMDNGGACPSTDLYSPTGNDNVQYNEVVHFCCEDVQNGPIMVQLRVCDDADMNNIYGSDDDNCNFSMLEVTVQDKLLPILQCPSNAVITCDEYYALDPTDTNQWNSLFGEPYSAGTCDISVDQYISTNDLLCGEGIIERVFTATTAAGTTSCTQLITVIPGNDAYLTCDRISFEGLDNNVYNWCAVNDNDNDNDDDLPAILIDGCEGFDIAELDINTNGLCTTVGYQVEVDTFTYTGIVCKKYVIHYEVLDQCVFDENFVDPITGQINPFHSQNGYFEFYLEYNVTDNDAPILNCNNREIEANTCDGLTDPITLTATDECTDDNILVYEWKIDLGNNGTIDYPFNTTNWYSGNSFTAQTIGLDALPIGEHRVYWRVGDGCGNVGSCSEIITITSFLKAPTPICYNGISTAVMQIVGTVDVAAEIFDKGSFDDCGSPIDITIIPEDVADASSTPFEDSKEVWTFTCDDISNGIYENILVRIYVVDNTGAYDYCTTLLRLEDNEAGACNDNTTTTTLGGNLMSQIGEPLENIQIHLESDQPEYPQTVLTDENGNYSFEANTYFNYDIKTESDEDYLNGVSTLDIVLIQKHILGIEKFDNPFTSIAADINNDCKVTGTDIIQLRKLLLAYYIDNKLPFSDSWRYLTEENTYYNGVQPCDLSEEYNITKLEGTTLNQNFVGVKVGDVNNNASVNLNDSNVETRSSEELIFLIQDREVEAGELITVDITSLNYQEVYGYQFTLDFDPSMLEFRNMFSRTLDLGTEHLNLNDTENGKIALSFADVINTSLQVEDKIFSIVFLAKKSGTLKDVLGISSSAIQAEAYVGEELHVTDVVLRTKEGEFSDDKRFELYQNKPNPFKNSTTIGFELEQDGLASIRIYDITGNVIYTQKDNFLRGYNEIIVKKQDLNANGVMYIHLESNGDKAVKKMLLIN